MDKRRPYAIDLTEEKANEYVAKTLLVFSAVLVFAFLLNELDVFKITKSTMRFCTPLCLFFSLVPSILAHHPKTRHNSDTKYLMILNVIVASGIVVTMLNFHVTVILILPLLVSTQYHSKRITGLALAGTLIDAAVAPYLGCLIGTWQNDFFVFLEQVSGQLSYEAIRTGAYSLQGALKLLLFIVIPTIFILSIYYEIITSITKSGIELNHLRKNLQKEVDKQTRKLLEQQKKSQQTTIEIVSALIGTSEAKDIYTAGHGQRVANLSARIAKELGWYIEDIDVLFICAILHDIGKIAIPDEILKSNRRLTKEEYDKVKLHTTRGNEILSEISSLRQASTVALNHHERWDGTGYPNGLKGEEIDEFSRIVSVADSFDAMTSNRAYRNNLPIEKVIDELRKGKGTQFDPVIAEVMIKLINEGEVEPSSN